MTNPGETESSAPGERPADDQDGASQGPPSHPQEAEGPTAPPPAPEVPQEQKTWGMLCHLSALAGYIIPFGNVIGPLIVWMIKKDEMPFVDKQGKESVNFQISVSIYAAVSAALIFACVGMFLLPAVGIFALVMIIIASVKANGGESFRYPLCIRFIK